ncbi:tape_meas_TP901, phage tail tape measure protein, TP901 family, core region [uncultured Caudovirales phage]|uniref:Tape_meas_TP901, phage tail tape measure protein, TP901 family, core region n=1 Tax=uncultured Caudovirales phage TaxID=2100421 RepID=A0A6J5N5F6_9CAUD|nr:tape_meas_TP901, phage tail tape measure protein, TP901 family, core region [uncultured Caudovirales phage]
MSININILSNFNSSGFDKLSRELGRLDTPIEKIGAVTRSLAPAAIIGLGALAVGASKSVTEANDLAIGLREVVTLTGDTGDAANATFGEFQSLIADVSNEFGIAQSVLTGGLYQALSAGVPKDNALEFMQVASQAAIAGVTDVETAVDGLSTIINAFGLDTEDAQAVADSMFAAVKGGKTTFEELSASMFNVAPAAAAAGIGFDEVNAAIATMTSAGVPTAQATTQIRAAMVGLQKPSEDLDAIFQDLGYNSAQTAIEEEGLAFALDAVKDASGGSNGKLQELLGSVEAVSAVNILAGTGAEKFASELERQSDAAGSVQDAFDEIDKSRVLERQGVAFENMGIAIGNILLPAMEFLLPILTGFTDWASENAGVVVVLAGVFAALATAILLVNFAMNANPIVKIITGIALLIAAVVLLVDWLVDLYGGWDKLFTDLGKWIKGFSIAFEKALFEIGQFFGELFGAIGAIAKGALNGILAFVEGYINFIIGGINGLIGLINTVLGAGKAIGINLQIGTIPKVTIPRLAEGGIVMPRPGGVLANIAEGGQAEAVIPLNKMKDFGGGTTNNYTINVNGGVGSGATIGKSIVDAIKAYERSSGAVWQGA